MFLAVAVIVHVQDCFSQLTLGLTDYLFRVYPASCPTSTWKGLLPAIHPQDKAGVTNGWQEMNHSNPSIASQKNRN